MLDAYAPYLEMFGVLRSEFAGRNGIANWAREQAELGAEEVELFLELEGAVAEHFEETRKRERQQRAVTPPRRR